MMKLFFIFLILSPLMSLALEIDEKLTGRILKVSQSKKTILINRGIEDGLAEGDHAKFYLSVGVVARGVVVKSSPTRSVWSVYRLVNHDYIKEEQVVNLKISAPVKITKDESRMLVEENTPDSVVGVDPRNLGIPLAEGAEDLAPGESLSTRSNLNQMERAEVTSIANLNIELWGSLQFTSITAHTVAGDGSSETTGDEPRTALTFGGEYYFKEDKLWYGRLSFGAYYSMTKVANMIFSGGSNRDDSHEFGGSLFYHPLAVPSAVNKIIPFGTFSYLMGTSTSTYNPGEENSVGKDEIVAGVFSGYSLGGGVKYYTAHGYGARITLDYYARTDEFETDEYSVLWTKTHVGPRLYMAISYRF
jgi:hypothetical protein